VDLKPFQSLIAVVPGFAGPVTCPRLFCLFTRRVKTVNQPRSAFKIMEAQTVSRHHDTFDSDCPYAGIVDALA